MKKGNTAQDEIRRTVFHACVCTAATCQYLSITLITARIAG